MIEIVSAASLGWKILAKTPRLAGWVLRCVFPIAKCRDQLRVSVPGNQARFELLKMRPTPALIGLVVEIYNPLPFAVSVEFHSAQASLNSAGFLGAVLNSRCTISASGFASICLPEFALMEQTANWILGNANECARLSFHLHWRCTSSIQNWESEKAFDFIAYVNRDAKQAPGKGTHE